MNIWIFGVIIIIIMVLYSTVPPGDAIAKLNPLEENYPARKCNRKCGAKVSITKYIYLQSTTVYVPSSEWGLSHPLSPQRVCRRNQRGGGHTRLRVRGWGPPDSDDWRKSLALCLLCGFNADKLANGSRRKLRKIENVQNNKDDPTMLTLWHAYFMGDSQLKAGNRINYMISTTWGTVIRQ
jgi:hypothetical protein